MNTTLNIEELQLASNGTQHTATDIVPHMITIAETARKYGVAAHFVRQLVSSGRVIAVRAGRKFLVNDVKFAEFLNTSRITEQAEDSENDNGITPIPIKL